MKKIILIYGAIGGAIVSAMLVIAHPLTDKGIIDQTNGMLIGYASMIIALSLIFFAIKNYRDNHQSGVISFGKALQIGLLITLVASCLYALTWEVMYQTSASNFMEEYTAQEIKKLESSGMPADEVEAKKQEMLKFAEAYKNPVVRFAVTAFVEMAPVGVLVSLIAAALLRRRKFLPAS